jgi:outer membrane protein TolC
MKKPMRVVFLFAALAGFGLAQAPAGPEKPVTLEECILGALKNNLKLAAEVLGPEMDSFAVRQANEIFIPKLSVNYGQDSLSSASYSFIQAADQIATKDKSYSTSLSQLIPTGARIGVSLRSFQQNTNQSFLTINPLYGSTLTFDLSQPLLRDFGFKMTRRQIIIAQYGLDISENQLRQTLLNTIYSVEEAYWNLVYSRENLRVQRESLELARELLAKNKRELEVGMIPPLDLLSAQAEVASREADILQAEAGVKDSQDVLRTLINFPREKGSPAPVLVPSDRPKTEPVATNLDEANQTALANRPDLASLRVDLKSKGLNLSYARNQLLPNLSLRASYWSPGYSGTELIYENGDPLTGHVIGTIPHGASLALKDAVHFKYKNWSVGLTLDIPLESAFSRAQYAQARLDSRQSLLLLRDQEQQVELEVQTVLRAVDTNYKRTLAYKAARELAEEKLKAEEKKLAAGLSTNYTVLQQQRDLATARSNEVKALTDYNLSLARMAKALGTTLKDKNISLAGSAWN